MYKEEQIKSLDKWIYKEPNVYTYIKHFRLLYNLYFMQLQSSKKALVPQIARFPNELRVKN